MENSNELLPVVDESGRVIGSATRGECCDGSKRFLHPVVHLHIVDAQGRLLLQLRSRHKKIQPGKWDTAVGGHVGYNEPIETALRREAFEEVGLQLTDFKPVKTYVFESAVERELVNCYMAVAPDGFTPVAEEGEIDEVRFWSREELCDAIGRGILTPNLEDELRNFMLVQL